MRTAELVLCSVILVCFVAARLMPSLGFVQGYYLYVVIGLFSYWLPKKIELLWIVIFELQIGLRLIFFDWWMYMKNMDKFLTAALNVPLFSDLQLLIFGVLGLTWVFASRLIVYYYVKRRLGKKLRDRLPNLYNMTE